MLKLQLLGSLDLLDAGRDVSLVLRRPKSLALLAYLAAARPRGFHRRDTLLALFWPDLDQAHARNSLRQAVHSLRQVVGAETIVGRGEEELSVDRSRLWCDVTQFEQHLEAGESKSAVVLYRGALLSGFHIPGNEFEQWLDHERHYLAKRALAAALVLSKDAERSADFVAAAYWARRGNGIRPDHESGPPRPPPLLHHAGGRAGAGRGDEGFAHPLPPPPPVTPPPGTRPLLETGPPPGRPQK